MFTALAAVATAGLGGLGIRSGAARYYDGPVSDHFDGLRFLACTAGGTPYGAGDV
jgi:hypothetical protein